MIKQALSEHQNAIWEIFRDVVKAGNTYTFSPDITQEEAMQYWMNPNHHIYIFEHEGEVAGTYIIKNNQPGLGAHIANASFMVSKHHRGMSIGYKMGQHAIKTAQELGYYAMQFNIVISTNEPAIRLWKKLSFEIIGTTPKAFHHLPSNKLVDAHIMYRKL